MRSLAQLSVILALLATIPSAWANAKAPVLDKKTFTISGQVGVPGVTMVGLPGNPMSNENGVYGVQVEEGWSGQVTPVKIGYTFDPMSRRYTPVTSDQTGEDYTVRRLRMSTPMTAQDVLVIPTTGVNAAAFAETAEDMRVMLQILREKTNEQRAGAGRTVLPDYGPIFGPSGRGTNAMYLQGYAAMFVMEVGFPLIRSSEPNAAGGRTGDRAGDPVWQQARQRLAGSGQGDSPDGTSSFNVDQFKENMVRALRHAANIRHLDPNERVILTIVGSARPASAPAGVYGMAGSTFQGGGSFYGGSSFSTDSTSGYTDSGGYTSFSTQSGGRGMGSMGPAAPAAGNVLTIQAKKADIDAFAKDQISFDQFSQKVRVFTY